MSKHTTTAERLIASGHKPKLDEDGEPDAFAIDFGFHNGPMCSVCGEGRCEHCDDGSPFDPCPGHEVVDERKKQDRQRRYEELRDEFGDEATRQLVEQRDALIADCQKLIESEIISVCESCGAWLMLDDDYVSSDDGVSGCWAGITDDPRADDHPCYAYRMGKPDARTRTAIDPKQGAF